MAKDDNKETATDVRRSFEHTVEDGTKKYYLGMPNSEQIKKAEWHYSKIYNRALIEGVATTSEMMDILTKRGIYGPEYEKRIQELQVDIALKIASMQNEVNLDAKETLAKEVDSLRNELYRWNQRITGPLSNSCEQMAEDAKTEYLVSVIVQDEKGDLVWDNYDSFVMEKDQTLALQARYQVLLWLRGLDVDFLDKTPEGKVLREVAEQKAAAAVVPPLLEAPEEDAPVVAAKVSSPKVRKVRAK